MIILERLFVDIMCGFKIFEMYISDLPNINMQIFIKYSKFIEKERFCKFDPNSVFMKYIHKSIWDKLVKHHQDRMIDSEGASISILYRIK